MKNNIFSICLVIIGQFASGQNHITFQDTIKTYLGEIREATKKGTLVWGTDLWGPILLVNPDTRKLYSNFPDSVGVLKQEGNIYSGNLPAEINIANTSFDWNGRRWAMIMLPLPTDKFDRINLMAHELFHKAQPSLGFQLFNTENNHLDKKEGRVYLRLELEALKKAVNAESKDEIRLCLAHALAFRKYRYIIYPGSDSTENYLELNEGLAEYTGFILSNRTQQQAKLHFNKSISAFLSNPTFVRSFAYQTIPIYGYLLHSTQENWIRNISVRTNLADYFIKAFNISLDSDLKKTTDAILAKYSGLVIIKEETAREEKTKKIIEEYTKRFIDQPHFEIHFVQMSVSFDPRNIMPIEEKGTVYHNIRVSDKWGILTVTNGALMSPVWDKISITIPLHFEGNNISGDGWTLTLNDGYVVVKDESTGNYKLKKK